MQRPTMEEVRATYKRRDAWWTVVLVDPVAGPLVRLVAPYRWITPNLLTVGSFVLGVAASACFLAPSYGWVYLGALLFHLAFVLDCMDGKLARLRRSFSLMGSWLDFASDRLQFIMATFTLMGGQYLRTHRPVYLFLAAVIVAVGLFRYVHSAAIDRLEDTVRSRTAAAYAAAGQHPPAGAGTARERVGSAELLSRLGPAGRVKEWLNRHRVRLDVVSGIEFEMAVKVVAPLTGWLIGVPLVAGALLLLFEVFFVYRLFLAVRAMERTLAGLAAAGTPAAPSVPAPATEPAVPASAPASGPLGHAPMPAPAAAADEAAYLPSDAGPPQPATTVPPPAPSQEQRTVPAQPPRT